MKKISVLLVALVLAFVSIASAQLSIIAPTKGDSLPSNGQIYFWWSNQVPLEVTTSLVHANQGYEIVTPMVRMGYFHQGLDYTSYQGPELTSGHYSFRVDGVASNGQKFSDERPFRVGPKASLEVNSVTKTDWHTNRTKAFFVSWKNCSVGDEVALYLIPGPNAPIMNQDYTFVLKSMKLKSVSGKMIITCPFPNRSLSSDPSHPVDVIDADHTVVLVNNHSLLQATSEPVSVVLDDVHLRVTDKSSVVTNFAYSGYPATPLHLEVEATSDGLSSLTVPILAIGPTNVTENFVVVDNKNNLLADGTIEFGPQGRGKTSFTTPLNTKRGQKFAMNLEFIPNTTGRYQFAIDPSFELNYDGSQPIQAISQHKKSLTVAQRGIWGPRLEVEP